MTKTTDAKREDELRPLRIDELEAVTGGLSGATPATFNHGSNPYGGGYCGTRPPGPRVLW